MPVGVTSEDPLEHLHHIIRGALRHHVLTCSLEMAHESLLRYILMCSAPTITANYPGFEKIKKCDIDEELGKLLLKDN